MIEGIDKISKEIHENAVAHGWWETERSFGEICALIHSELSEALEEYRAGHPNFWYTREDGTVSENMDEWQGEKPEGIAVELADAVIRILDCMEHRRMMYSRLVNDSFCDDGNLYRGFGDFISYCHAEITDAQFIDHGRFADRFFTACICRIKLWFDREGFDLSKIIAIKHQYNKTRPYKHGGKKI